MRNSPRLPAVALAAAILLAIHLVLGAGRSDEPLTELGIAEAGIALTLAMFGLQGLLSVAVEGQELHPGRTPARLTNPLSLAIVVFSVFLFAISVALAYGIVQDWGLRVIGTLAGGGALILAALLVFYKEAFVGDEATFDTRKDGIPW